MNIPDTLYIESACRIVPGQAWKDDELIFGQAGTSTESFLVGLYKELQVNYPKWYKMDRLSQLGLLAAELLLPRTLGEAGAKPMDTAIVLSNRHSSLDTDTRFADQLADIPSPAVFVYTLPNIVIGEITIRFGIKGEQAFYLMDKPDWAFLQQVTQALFSEGQVKYCLLGWVDLFQENYEAVMFLVSANAGGGESRKIMNTKNLYQYHEQGAVN
ncbi:hypothetical protein [Flavihumibacter profundi]|uniref:hypothetical protein n=1 Tax=Flavihumibacter profundi TaxID=2716883 RepID=UPI001CC69F00|nr:hypothetical protein [Flavihumibacter profundi]MBZ5858859.1 hypothetical protein [Flavihumibacter profundi]